MLINREQRKHAICKDYCYMRNKPDVCNKSKRDLSNITQNKEKFNNIWEKCIKVDEGKITLVKIVRNESLYLLCRDTNTTKN